MKKIIVVYAFIVILSLNVKAFSLTETEITPDTLIQSLPDEYKEYIPDDIFEGENSVPDTESFVNYVLKTIKDSFSPAIKMFSDILSLIILLSLINSLINGFNNKSYSGYIKIISVSVISLTSFSYLKDIWLDTEKYITVLNNLINSFIPIITSIFIFCGNAATAVVQSSGMYFGITLSNNILYYFLYPLLNLCYFVTFAGFAGNFPQMKYLSNTLQKIFSGLLSGLAALSTIYLLFQNYITSAADNITAKTIKFAGGLIPVIGSSVGDSVKLIISSVTLIKNTSGVTGIVVIMCICLPTIIKILINKIVFSLLSGIAGLLGETEESNFLNEINKIINFAFAITVSVTIMFIFEIVIFINTSLAMGG